MTATDILHGAHRRYTPARLGAVTAVSPSTGLGGVSFVTEAGEQKFLISADELETFVILLAEYLTAYHLTKVQSLNASLGSKSLVLSPDEVLK